MEAAELAAFRFSADSLFSSAGGIPWPQRGA